MDRFRVQRFKGSGVHGLSIWDFRFWIEKHKATPSDGAVPAGSTSATCSKIPVTIM